MPLKANVPHSFYYSIATAINVVTDTVYIGGVDDYQSVYWKNGTENPVADGYQVNAIAVNKGDVYVAGSAAGPTGYNSPEFWRNGIGFFLDNNPGSANAIVVTN
jgi:hypothetical protein